MKGHTSNRQIKAVMLGMARDAQHELDMAKANGNKESMEYWIGFVDSLKQLDIFLYQMPSLIEVSVTNRKTEILQNYVLRKLQRYSKQQLTQKQKEKIVEELQEFLKKIEAKYGL